MTYQRNDVDWVCIPEGEFLYGPKRVRRYLREYHIGKYPVTYSVYDDYVRATCCPWSGRSDVADYDTPATHVTWSGAFRYCKWLNEETGHKYAFRLPSTEEWEKAIGRVTSVGLWEWMIDKLYNDHGRVRWDEHILRRYHHGTVKQRVEEAKRDYKEFGFRIVANLPKPTLVIQRIWVCEYCGRLYETLPLLCTSCQSPDFVVQTPC